MRNRISQVDWDSPKQNKQDHNQAGARLASLQSRQRGRKSKFNFKANHIKEFLYKIRKYRSEPSKKSYIEGELRFTIDKSAGL